MKKLLFSLGLYCLVNTTADAQTGMARFLGNTPDSVFELVNNEMFAKLVDYVQIAGNDHSSDGLRLEVVNRLGEKSTLDTISSDYASLSVSGSLKVQLMMLPVDGGSDIVCMVKTYLAPEPESVVSFFNLDWQPLPAADYLAPVCPEQLCARPDTMTGERYDEWVRYIDPAMIYAEAVPEQKALVFHLATPMLSNGDAMQVNAILLQRKVKWNGKTFEKC